MVVNVGAIRKLTLLIEEPANIPPVWESHQLIWFPPVAFRVADVPEHIKGGEVLITGPIFIS